MPGPQYTPQGVMVVFKSKCSKLFHKSLRTYLCFARVKRGTANRSCHLVSGEGLYLHSPEACSGIRTTRMVLFLYSLPVFCFLCHSPIKTIKLEHTAVFRPCLDKVCGVKNLGSPSLIIVVSELPQGLVLHTVCCVAKNEPLWDLEGVKDA